MSAQLKPANDHSHADSMLAVSDLAILRRALTAQKPVARINWCKTNLVTEQDMRNSDACTRLRSLGYLALHTKPDGCAGLHVTKKACGADLLDLIPAQIKRAEESILVATENTNEEC